MLQRWKLELGLLAAITLVGWAWLELPQWRAADYAEVAERGAYGDTFGTVTALFTGLAFALLIYTALLQRQELSLQRKELHDTRRELKGQGDTLKLQRFEHTFFQLLRVHIDIVSDLSMPVVASGPAYGAMKIQRGRRCLWEKRVQLKGWFETDQRDAQQLTMDSVCGRVLYAPEAEPNLAHYFRQLYHIIRFVDDGDIEDKRRYINFVQAQMDNDELVLLAYNGLTDHGENFKPLIEKYGLLENLAAGSFFSEEHFGLYEKAAFGNREYRHGVEFS